MRTRDAKCFLPQEFSGRTIAKRLNDVSIDHQGVDEWLHNVRECKWGFWKPAVEIQDGRKICAALREVLPISGMSRAEVAAQLQPFCIYEEGAELWRDLSQSEESPDLCFNRRAVGANFGRMAV
jgi:hypothetical protein